MNSDISISSSDSYSDVEPCDSGDFQKVFEAMKHTLSNPTSDQSIKDGSKLVTKHNLICQTFNDPVDSDSDSSVDEEDDNKETTESIEQFEFFIDKGPMNASDDTKHAEFGTSVVDPEDVVSYDLSTLGNDENSNDEIPPTDKKQTNIEKKKRKRENKNREDTLSTKIQTDLNFHDVYVNVDPYRHPKTSQQISNPTQKHIEPEVMKKSVIKDDFEKQDSITTTQVSVRQQKKERKLEREKTKGDKWYNLPATEISDERKHDIEVLKMRKALNPKRFYKANDMKEAPKYFQFGRVVEDASDFYSSRIPKKQRKATIVEELLADSQFRQYNKRKYEEVQEAKRLGKGPYKHMKRLKKKKK